MDNIPVKSIKAFLLPALALVAISAATACTAVTGPSAPAGQNFQTVAAAGRNVYSEWCDDCHGNNGEPADKFTVLLWGPGSTLGRYHDIHLFSNAREMLDYISKSMPLEASGNLSGLQYSSVLAYILVRADMVSPSAMFDESRLSDIRLPSSVVPGTDKEGLAAGVSP